MEIAASTRLYSAVTHGQAFLSFYNISSNPFESSLSSFRIAKPLEKKVEYLSRLNIVFSGLTLPFIVV